MVKARETTVVVKTDGPATVRVTVRTAPARRLRFGKGNAKLGESVYTFSLPAGHTCPGADQCLSRADRATGKIKDGPAVKFRCYAASMEARHNSVRKGRWHNLGLLRGKKSGQVARLILDSLPRDATIVRVHESGDFFSQSYFDAWCATARARPGILFYAYTKNLPLWTARLGEVPSNLVLTASLGGRYDHLIQEHNLRSSRVVFSEAEAEALGLPIDHDDSHAMRHGPDFAHLLHGSQPKGSEAGRAWQRLKEQGKGGYGKSRLALVVV